MEEKIKVLVVDDDVSTRETYKEIFSWAGFDVYEAQDGQEGYEMIKKLHPDVVFTGINMPKVDGFELVEKVRTLKKEAPKMVINSHTDREEDRKKAEELKVAGYFVRGFASPKNVVNHIYKITGRSGLASGKILIVDDDKSTRETYKEVLRWAGFDAYEATNGKEAMDIVESVQPDVVFTGIMMPKMNGFELVRNIRKLAKKQPFVIINSHTDNEADRKQAAQLGVDGYFVRGFSAPRNVVNHIKRLLAEYEPRMMDSIPEDVSEENQKTIKKSTPLLSKDIIYLSIIVVISLLVIVLLLSLQRKPQEEMLPTIPTSFPDKDAIEEEILPPISAGIITGDVVTIDKDVITLESNIRGDDIKEVLIQISAEQKNAVKKTLGNINSQGALEETGVEEVSMRDIRVGDSLTINLSENIAVEAVEEEVIQVDDVTINIPIEGVEE